jgi:hypothetical protein
MARSKVLVFFAIILFITLPAGLVRAEDATISGSGTAVISDGAASGDTITYAMTGVPALADGSVYVGWLVSDDGKTTLNTGALPVGIDGSVSHTYVSADGENLIAAYNKVGVTSEEDANGASPSNSIVYSASIPSGAMSDIRSLQGSLQSLNEQLTLASSHAQLARSSDTISDVIAHTHHVINIIEGEAGGNFDSSFANPGDGVGVLAHAQSRSQASLAASKAPSTDPDETAPIETHAANVETSAANAEAWAITARDAAVDILGMTNASVAKTLLATVTGPLEAALNGISATGDSGAAQAYVEAQLMATYSISAGIPVDAPGCIGAQCPDVGDSAIPMLAQVALVVAMLLIAGGGLFMILGRRIGSTV